MTDANKPVMAGFDRHIFVCVGDKCNQGEGAIVYEHLKQELKKGNQDPALKRVKRSKTQCLQVCQGGPISVVYPEGIWYCHMTTAKMDRVIHEHLKAGKPVQEWVFHGPAKS